MYSLFVFVVPLGIPLPPSSSSSSTLLDESHQLSLPPTNTTMNGSTSRGSLGDILDGEIEDWGGAVTAVSGCWLTQSQVIHHGVHLSLPIIRSSYLPIIIHNVILSYLSPQWCWLTQSQLVHHGVHFSRVVRLFFYQSKLFLFFTSYQPLFLPSYHPIIHNIIYHIYPPHYIAQLPSFFPPHYLGRQLPMGHVYATITTNRRWQKLPYQR